MSKTVIGYDLRTTPDGWGLEELAKAKELGFVFYVSDQGEAPTTLKGEELKFIDTTSEEGKKLLNELNLN
jgi:hypothetical protein